MRGELSRILYVEDEPDIRLLAQMALEDVGGFALQLCSSGPEALEKISAFQPQLILMDVMMPLMDGPTTLGKIRELPDFISTPVIFMTARVQPGEMDEYKQLGAVEVIPKPFKPMTLARTVREIWARCGV